MYLHCVYKFCIRCDIYCPGSIAGATKKQWLEGKSSNHCFKKTLWTGQGPIHSISYYNYIPFALYCNCSLISHVSTFILSETGFPKTLTGDTRQSFYRYFPKKLPSGRKIFLICPPFFAAVCASNTHLCASSRMRCSDLAPYIVQIRTISLLRTLPLKSGFSKLPQHTAL